MSTRRFNIAFWALLLGFSATACTGGGGGSGGSGTPTPTPTATATPEPPGGGDTCVVCEGDEPGLCNAGDVARVDFSSAGTARFPLILDDDPCTPAKDNREEEYTLILYNTTGSPITFRVDSTINVSPPDSNAQIRIQDTDDIPAPRSPHSGYSYRIGPNRMTEAAVDQVQALRLRHKDPVRYLRSQIGGSDGLYSQVVGEEGEFRIRDSRDDQDSFTTTSAILRSQGDHINIYVDRDVPFAATAVACDSHVHAADCLSEEELDRVVTIFDDNIHPLVTGLLGDESDVDGDERVNVVITPVMNKYLKADAYTDSRSLLPFNPISNPGSNESETIFVYAPDLAGNYKAGGNGVNANRFVSKSLAGWIAFQFTKIVSFNQHVLVNEGSAEDDWIDDGLGAVMADLCGFNIFRPSTYFFLSRPQLDDLRGAEDLDEDDWEGAEYLFMSYYVQSQVDSSAEDTNGDGFDDDLNFLADLMNSSLTGLENLENAVDVNFDETVETEFQAMFKDWTIAIATSGTNRTDLQVSGQTAVKYFFRLNSTRWGSGIGNSNGSVRVGADGNLVGANPDLDFDNSGALDGDPNDIGLDLNLFHPEDEVLVENADEHVWAPGNTLYGYIDPFAAMYVRLAGHFQRQQTVSLKGSSSSILGFLIKRSNITYPHVYSESVFTSVDQFPEDLDVIGPNPYWLDEHGIDKKVDYQSLAASTALGEASQDFLSIVGRIDAPSSVWVCNSEDCGTVEVPDTDKYVIHIPCLDGTRIPGDPDTCATSQGDEGNLAIVLRRQFDDGSDESALKPMIAVVSSKDVPYPYVPHPIRGDGNAIGGGGVVLDSRPQFRWLTGSVPCADGDAGNFSQGAGGACTDATPAFDESGLGETISRFTVDGLFENTGTITSSALDDGGDDDQVFAGHTTDESQNGNLSNPNDPLDANATDCDNTPDLMANASARPKGVSTIGYGAGGYYPVTANEVSPSSLGGYGDSFMTSDYESDGFAWDKLFSREFLISTSGYPSVDDESPYDPRSTNNNSLNCQVRTAEDDDESADAPDDLLAPGEIKGAGSLAEQVLIEMSRSRRFDDDGDPSNDEYEVNNSDLTSGWLRDRYEDYDIFAIDGDSFDTDSNCNTVDVGNNVHGFTMRTGEGSLLWGNYSSLAPHIAENLNVSAISTSDTCSNASSALCDVENFATTGSRFGQNVYNPPPEAGVVGDGYGDSYRLTLTPGKSYTIIVAGNGGTRGNYELRLRKYNLDPDQTELYLFEQLGSDEDCDFEF